MENKYRKIEILGGESIESAMKELDKYKQQGELVFLKFNDHFLYSDVDDLESAYQKIMGMSKADFDRQQNDWKENYEKELKEHKDSIPQLTKEWIEKGKEILDQKHHEYWSEIVPIRLSDLYRGMELGCCLDIVKQLNNNCTLEKAKEIISNQGHSGMSFNLVCAMVKKFSDRGSDFIQFVKSKQS